MICTHFPHMSHPILPIFQNLIRFSGIQEPPTSQSSTSHLDHTHPILPIYHLGFEHSLDATILSFTTSYYYAHARAKDYHVPTVPMRMDTDGSLTPWVPPVAAGQEVGGSGGLGSRRI